MRKLPKTRASGLSAVIPRVVSLRELLFETPGSWLYRRPITSWLSDPSLVAQLPRPYRFFAWYCAVQPADPIGAEVLLRLIASRRRRHGFTDCVPLQQNGVTIHLDLQDPRFLRIPGELLESVPLLSHFLRPGDTFIDIGANHGAYAVAAAALVGPNGLVLAIEPQPRLARAVERSLGAGHSPFEVHQAACGDSAGQVGLHIPLATSGEAGVFDEFSGRYQHRTILVTMRTLDDIVGGRRFPGRVFVKLDVEGSEISVLRGARRTIDVTKPAILTEVNPASLAAAGASTADLTRLLQELGYARFVTRNELEIERPLTDPMTERDIIALHGGG